MYCIRILILLLIPSFLLAQRKPNIIFILADDLGYGSIGAFGQQMIKTPNLDKLAKGGMKLTNFYANPICAPTRASFFTGMSSAHCVIRDNYELGGYEDSTEFGQMPLPANTMTLGKLLKGQGYKTAVFGKWGMGGPNSTGVPWKQGIDEFYGYLDQKQAHNYYPSHLWRNNISEKLPNHVVSAHQKLPPGANPEDDASYSGFKGNIYSCDTITSEALKFIRQNKQSPFFMYLAYTIPHMALQVPDKYLLPYLGKFNEKPVSGGGYLPVKYPYSTYAAMITLLDEYIGRVVKQLQDAGLDKNTLIVFTGDNGAAGGGANTVNPDYFNCSANLRGRKGTLYEGGIREPFIAFWPDKIKAGDSSGHAAVIWDMLPTFMEAAGINKTEGVDGISILPLLRGRSNQKQHEYLYWEIHRPGKGIQAARFGKWKAVRRQTHVNPNNPIELYDLENDISETTDISAKHPELVKKADKYFKNRETATLSEWNFYTEPKKEE
ncbi:MAG TPA: arylsulfatase [Flavitalea sp.]|nr:arylsulfatase [Flavitalea sp.]